MGTGAEVTLRAWYPVSIPAGSPGEIGGPGVALQLRVMNGSAETIDLGNVVVDLRYGKDRVPAVRSDRRPTEAFSGTLAPGSTATATYAFRVNEGDRDRVRVLVRLEGDAPVVVFKGDLSS